jgi:hypothetical protein
MDDVGRLKRIVRVNPAQYEEGQLFSWIDNRVGVAIRKDFASRYDPPMEAFESFSNFYQSGPYQPYIRSFRPIGQSGVCVTELSQPGGEFPDPAIPEFSLQWVTGGGANQRGQARISYTSSRSCPGATA